MPSYHRQIVFLLTMSFLLRELKTFAVAGMPVGRAGLRNGQGGIEPNSLHTTQGM